MFEEPERHTPAIEGLTAASAFVIDRNRFGPGRGEWDLDCKGWWDDEPPYHGPVFVPNHHPREPLPMQAGSHAVRTVALDEFRSPRLRLPGALDSAGKRKNRSPVSLARESREFPRPAGSSALIAVGGFCHVNAATCQNCRELPQIASICGTEVCRLFAKSTCKSVSFER